MSAPQVILLVAGVQTEIYGRLHCAGCDGNVVHEFPLTGRIVGTGQEIPVCVTEPEGARPLGWFVFEGEWYCPKHVIQVVDREPVPA